ncbi:UNVERIFIED_CONTAM: protein FANTASTIC FOUR 3 [Sesamum latifolium]|uniref:Protein FANTASTIC FOUR 3 n=1 Tax=Sesamum latifolium TaxID=2727402 RepID=A0AAW2XZD4_9LAMI
MSGSSSLQVRRHREDGRLIIEAVEAPFRNSYLQAERSDGRLRLCFLTGSDRAEITTSTAGEEHEEEEEKEEEKEEENGDECGGETTEEDEIEEASSDVEEFDGEINLEMEMEMEMEMEKFQRLSRCKEEGHGNKGLCSNWKPALWVAIS